MLFLFLSGSISHIASIPKLNILFLWEQLFRLSRPSPPLIPFVFDILKVCMSKDLQKYIQIRWSSKAWMMKAV